MRPREGAEKRRNDMARTILVTGSTGNLGRAVAEALLERGFRVRAAVHRRGGGLLPPGAEPVPLDYDDPSTVPPALAGTDGVFVVAPPLDPEAPRRLAPLAEEVGHGPVPVVLTSALGADASEESPLRILERRFAAAGAPLTVLRPTFFMENFSEGFLAPAIRGERAIRLPAGDGRTGFVSVRDVAAVAAAAFAERLHGKAFPLTGPESLDHREAARRIGNAFGEEVRYVPLEEEAFLAGARQAGMEEGAARYLALLYRMVREGRTDVVTGAVEAVTGRRPVSFREFALRNAAAWRRAG
jgi:uncharacterized protein YbjT (DUF2867 family)